MRPVGFFGLLVMVGLSVISSVPTAAAPPPVRTVEFRFTPTARTQIALWIERPDGTFMGTVRLTQALSVRGIGNRPGASQMNSAYRWPYGRREGALPIWAHRRAGAANTGQFKRVIFQDRRLGDGSSGEGLASRTSVDSSPEPYFCLSFSPAAGSREALDAVTCATARPPQTDKGRYIDAADVASGYGEPVEIAGVGSMRPLDLVSLYPPRRDVLPCLDSCPDRPDALDYAGHAREVMPDIDAVTMATPPAEAEQSVLFSIPDDWADGDYVAWIEVNVEGDYNSTFDSERFPTPQNPSEAWDVWAINTGYPYRGQPSVAFSVAFSLGAPGTFATRNAAGYGDVDGFGSTGGQLHPMDGLITDAPDDLATQGSGVDRLRIAASRDYRFQVDVRDTGACAMLHLPPQAPTALMASPDGDRRHSHQWGRLHFVVPSSDRPLDRYEVRISKSAITSANPLTFDQSLPAMAAETDSVALTVPTTDAPGTGVDVRFGGMEPLAHYFVAIRAVDSCNVAGPFAVAELTTTRINFTQLSGCFIATAAYGSAMEPEVQALRTVRDTLRSRSPLFAVATDLYYRSGPAAAAVIARSDVTRALVRTVLGAAVAAARVEIAIAGTARP